MARRVRVGPPGLAARRCAAVADPWITLAAAATATERVLLGPMVTPLARRRPTKRRPGDREAGPAQRRPVGARRRPGQRPVRPRVLRHRRRGGRPTSRCDARRGADRPRRGLVGATDAPPRRALRAWTTSRSCPVRRTRSRSGSPGSPGSARPRRRAATREGFFPVNLEHPDELAACGDRRLRGLDLPDIVVARPAGTDVTAFAEVGATWWLTDFDPRTRHARRGPRRAAGRPGVTESLAVGG